MPPALVIGGSLGLSALGGALSGRKSANTQTNMPQTAPQYKGLEDMLIKRASSRLNTDPNLTGYTSSGLSNINSVYDLVRTQKQNDLTRRGLSTSPIAAVVDETSSNARAGDITDFLNSIPLLKRQLQDQDFNSASALLGHGTGTQTVLPNSASAGAMNSLGSMLGFLIGQGAFA
jgi:hypothetical protein